MNFVKFLRTPFFKEHFWWLLQNNENGISPRPSQRRILDAMKHFKENIHKIFSGADSFQCGMQLLIWGEKLSHYLWVVLVNVTLSLALELLFLS